MSFPSILTSEIEFQRDKGRKRCDRSSESSYICSDKHSPEIIGKWRQEYCRWNVAYDLRYKSRGKHRLVSHRGFDESPDAFDASEIHAEYEEGHECKKKDVVDSLEYLPVEDNVPAHASVQIESADISGGEDQPGKLSIEYGSAQVKSEIRHALAAEAPVGAHQILAFESGAPGMPALG